MSNSSIWTAGTSARPAKGDKSEKLDADEQKTLVRFAYAEKPDENGTSAKPVTGGKSEKRQRLDEFDEAKGPEDAARAADEVDHRKKDFGEARRIRRRSSSAGRY